MMVERHTIHPGNNSVCPFGNKAGGPRHINIHAIEDKED